MSEIDHENLSKNFSSNADANEIDLADADDILRELENEDIPSHIREARLNELVLNSLEKQFKQKNKDSIYAELNEKEFLNLTVNNKRCIILFYHPDFRRCDIMNSHLQKLALKYDSIKFAKVNVDKAKFFVDKLKIQVLPALICFVDGIVRDKIIGFDELGGGDSFPTQLLEKRLRKKGIIKREDADDDENGSEDEDKKKTIFSRGNNQNDSDSD